MTRHTRTKSYVLPYSSGTHRWRRNTATIHVEDNGFGIKNAVCQDSIGRPVVVSDLNLDKYDRSGLLPLNGSNGPVGSTVTNWEEFINYIPTGLQEYSPSHVALVTRPSASSAMATLLARTNPNRPAIVPLSLLQDLVDIPRQLKDVGRLIKRKQRGRKLTAKDVANQHLGAQFGWLPLIKDVKDLLDLQSHIHQRLGELERLYSSQGLKRRIRLGEWGAEASVRGLTVMSVFALVAVDVDLFTKSSRWGTVRWKPSGVSPGYRPNDAELINAARVLVSGLTTESLLKGAWDLIPWTWIIDWFSNVGDFALQYANAIPVYSSEACVMTQTESKIQIRIATKPVWASGGGGSMTHITKERYTGPSTLTATWPLIAPRRLSILGALFVQRFKKKR